METLLSVGSTNPSKRKSDDIGWDYGEWVLENDLQKLRCKLCDKVIYGNINRLKQHVARIIGNVTPCENSSPIDQERCKKALQDRKKKKVLSSFSEASEIMVSEEDSMRSRVYIYDEKANEEVATWDGQPKVSKEMRMKSKLLVETDEEDDELINMRRVRASAATMGVWSCASPASVAASSEAEVRGVILSGHHDLMVRHSELDYTINMETEDTAAEQMREFSSKSGKQNDQLTWQVPDLESQIRQWKEQEAAWDEIKKSLERDRNEAWEEARRAILENSILKDKLEEASKEVEDAKASAKKAISELHSKFFGGDHDFL